METKNNVSIAVPEVLDSVTDGREESADELESIVQHLNEISMTFPLLVRKKPEARDCANIITAISSCLGNLVTFPDIPVGQKACKFLSNQWIAVRSLAEISVYLAIASLFLAIGQEVLDVPEEEFQKLVDNMEFVKEHFGAIRRNFKDVDDLWRKVLSESEMDGTTLENVKKLVDNAYMAVTHCQHKLKEFAKEDKGKITERFTGLCYGVKKWTTRCLRCILCAGGGFVTYHLAKTNIGSTRLAVLTGMSCFTLLVIQIRKTRRGKLGVDVGLHQQTLAEFERTLKYQKEKLENLRQQLNSPH